MSRFEIVTERLVLTPLGPRFLSTVNEYALDIENTRYMIHLPNETAQETLAFLQAAEAEWDRAQPDFYEFAVLYQDRHIGAASIYLEGGAGELGWIVNRRYWGHGFAAEAAQAIIDHFAAHHGVTHFIAHCDAANAASFKTMERLSMRRTAAAPGRRNRAADHPSLEYQYELYL